MKLEQNSSWTNGGASSPSRAVKTFKVFLWLHGSLSVLTEICNSILNKVCSNQFYNPIEIYSCFRTLATPIICPFILLQSFVMASQANDLKSLYTSDPLELGAEFSTKFLSSAWNLVLEKGHKHTGKSPTKSYKNIADQNRLQVLKLTTQEKRRIRGDLIPKFKIEKKLDIIEWENPPNVALPKSGRRGQHKREITKNCAQRYNF